MINKKPIVPSEDELKKNPPSRSSRLRIVLKNTDCLSFETDIKEKFKFLLDIENYSKKL